MKVFIVYCHPSEDSFTRNLRDAFIKGITDGGNEYVLSDLYAMDFDPDMTEEQYLRDANYRNDSFTEEDVLAEHAKINSADAIAFIYPVFWTEAPAKLVGWFDRVWTYGFAYGEKKMKMMDKAMILCSAGHTIETLEQFGFLTSMKKVMLRDRITWVSATCQEGDKYLLVICMFGTKRTKLNVIRTGLFSANLVSREMLPLMDYFGSKHAKDGKKNDLSYGVSRGEVLDVPTLDESPWVYECEVARAVETGDSTTFFCHIRNIQMDETLCPKDLFDIDLTVLDSVIYSGKYHSLGKILGEIGDFCKSR